MIILSPKGYNGGDDPASNSNDNLPDSSTNGSEPSAEDLPF
jgi:hypothetical protein